jgi:hypothetical protein
MYTRVSTKVGIDEMIRKEDDVLLIDDGVRREGSAGGKAGGERQLVAGHVVDRGA